MRVTQKQINKIKFQSCKLALDFLIFAFLEYFKLCVGIYLSLMKVALQVNNFYSIQIMLFANECSLKNAKHH